MAQKDICGGFGADLIVMGTVGVPKLLLHNYVRLGLREEELILILQIISLREQTPYPSPSQLAGLMGIDEEHAANMLGRLLEQKILAVDKIYDAASDSVVPAYSLTGLMERVSEIWAQNKAKALEKRKKAAKRETTNEVTRVLRLDSKTRTLIEAFEKEFGRPLSEIECSNILEWYEGCQFPPELILEALKRAVLNNTTNWRYINSILQQWYKKNLRTLQEVYEDDARFQANKLAKSTKSRATNTKGISLKDKYKDIYL